MTIPATSKILQAHRRMSDDAHAIHSFSVRAILFFERERSSAQYFPSRGDNFTSTVSRTIDVKIWQTVRQVLAYTYARIMGTHTMKEREKESAGTVSRIRPYESVAAKPASY